MSIESEKFKRWPDRASMKELIRVVEEGGRDAGKVRAAKIVVRGRHLRAVYGEADEESGRTTT